MNPAELTQWRRTAGAQWTRPDGRARVTKDTYQPAYTAELSDGTTRRTYSIADAIRWADRYADAHPDELPPRPDWTA